MVEIDIQDIFEELIKASIAAFLKNEALEQIFRGEVEMNEQLFNAFDGFVMAYKIPKFMLKMKLNQIKGTREALFVEGLYLHFEENANYIEDRITKCYKQFYQKMQEKFVDVLLLPGLTHPPVKHFQSLNSNL